VSIRFALSWICTNCGEKFLFPHRPHLCFGGGKGPKNT
jgi:hypothetical protein